LKKPVVATLALTLLLIVTVSPALRAQATNSEQVVFSGTGMGTFGGKDTAFGFWIWCEADSTNPYKGQCNGAMYFYALGITRHVVDGLITEPVEGQYIISVISTRDSTVSCTLENRPPSIPPVRGPHNTVAVECGTPVGNGATDTAVINVTGP
jgi:hypothetical protein